MSCKDIGIRKSEFVPKSQFLRDCFCFIICISKLEKVDNDIIFMFLNQNIKGLLTSFFCDSLFKEMLLRRDFFFWKIRSFSKFVSRLKYDRFILSLNDPIRSFIVHEKLRSFKNQCSSLVLQYLINCYLRNHEGHIVVLYIEKR